MDGHYAVTIVENKKTELRDFDFSPELKEHEILGRTLVSLISPGTELTAFQAKKGFPKRPGYGSVCEIEACGSAVESLKKGDRVFISSGHRSITKAHVSGCVRIPDELSAEKAVIVRLMQVPMTTLITTAARPGDLALVTGMGPVGYLAAHLFKISGYNVVVVEPDANRRELALKSGISEVYESMPFDHADINEKVAIVLECSGHEQAVLDGLKVVRPKGEVVMIGVPWVKRTELSAHDILNQVFHKYPILRSGWEWELPRKSSKFEAQSLHKNNCTGLQWLNEGRIPLEGLTSLHDPKDSNAVYQGHLDHTLDTLFTIFDWR